MLFYDIWQGGYEVVLLEGFIYGPLFEFWAWSIELGRLDEWKVDE